jgi:hypothetical protein
MTPSEVRAIRDALGGTKAMAERMDVCDRAVRYHCQQGVKRRKLEREIRGLVEADGVGQS